jgi:hypothetical protein
MAWGYDDWLMDREARRDWMRSVALLSEAIAVYDGGDSLAVPVPRA